MDISKANVGDHFYFNTVKGESKISIFNQMRAEAVRTLQEQCAFLFDEDSINALE